MNFFKNLLYDWRESCLLIGSICFHNLDVYIKTGLEVIKLEYSLRFKIKRNDWLLADTCPQAANHFPLF